MRELIDCHVHTVACGHALGSTSQMIDAASRAGLTGIVMTEHLPLPSDLDPGGSFAPSAESFAQYAHEVGVAADRAARVAVVLGAEADWLPHRPGAMEAQAQAARQAGVKVLLGSVHFIGDWPLDSPDHLDGWESRGVDVVWTQYFSLWCDAARSGLFDVMAHPDLPKKFGFRPSLDPREMYREAAETARDAGVLIEVSTAGLRKPVAELYPGPDLLSAFAAAGVGATVGSDAHADVEVGYRIEDAYAALSGAGYSRVAFPQGQREVRWIGL